MSESIGLIGIGLVGTVLAERLLDRGYEVLGYDIDPERCSEFDRRGGRLASGPAAVAQGADTVILSLTDSQAVRDVVEGPGGILQADRPPRWVIDTSTGDARETIELAERLAERNISYLDATILGSSEQVRRREAMFLVGAETSAFLACDGLLHLFSDKVIHLGPPGAGAKAKLAGNLVLGLNRLALAEGLVFAEGLGIEPAVLLELLKQSPAYSRVMDTKGGKMLSEDFAPEARLRQHRKDLDLIRRSADRLGLQLPLTEVHADVLDAAIAAGDGDLDNSAVIREIRRRSEISMQEAEQNA